MFVEFEFESVPQKTKKMKKNCSEKLKWIIISVSPARKLTHVMKYSNGKTIFHSAIFRSSTWPTIVSEGKW